MKYCVYMLLFNSNKSYIGVSKNLKTRLRNHRTSRMLVGRAFRKYGEPKIKILYKGKLQKCLDKEIQFIREFDTLSPNGYNLTSGGEGLFNPSEEVRMKLSNSAKNQDITKFQTAGIEARRGKPGPRKGKIVSLESRRLMSKAKLGNIPWNKGRSWTEEERKKLSSAHIGNRHSEETKQKMRGPRIRKVLS